MQYCSLQHQSLLPSPVTSTAGHCFHFGSFFILLELFFHSSPVAYWIPTNLESSFLIVIIFPFSYCSWGCQGKNIEVLPFPSSGPRLSELSTMTRLSWVALHSMTHCFIDLDKGCDPCDQFG